MSLSVYATVSLSGEGEGGAVCSLPSPSSREALPWRQGVRAPPVVGLPVPSTSLEA